MNKKVRDFAALIADPSEKRWVNWRSEMRDGKRTKVPKMSNGFRNAKPNDPATWSTLDEVIEAMSVLNGAAHDGIGVMFTESKMLLGIDIDHCIDNGEVSAEIAAIIEKAHTLTEISPSGTGLHMYLKLTEPLTLERKRSGSFECYTEGRWFTITGNEWKVSYHTRTATPEDALEVLRMFGYPWSKQSTPTKKAKKKSMAKVSLTDAKLREKMFAAKNGAKIRALYDGDTSEYNDDESSADAALCAHLAFWAGKDVARIESLWLASPLGAREKTQNRADYRKRTIENALKFVTESYGEDDKTGSEDDSDGRDGENDEPPRASQSTQVTELITHNTGMTLFLDEYRIAHVHMPVGDHLEIWPCGSSDFKYWLSNEFFTRTGKSIGTNVLSAALNTFEGKARASGLRYTLHNRIARVGDAIWYDLGDEKWRAIRIDAQGWNVVPNPPILFRRHSYHEPQVEPLPGGDVKELLHFVNVKDPDQQLLLLVYVIASFIPGFPHPLLYVHGSPGGAKSSLLEIILAIIDPSAVGSLSLSKNIENLKQTLHHHSAFACFDNVSGIDWETSDLLCRAVTGAGFEKRKLYTDDETVIYRVQANIAINGVNLGSSRPDLLDRSILMELSRLAEADKRQVAELQKAFTEARPKILGAIFDAIVQTLVILPNVKLKGMFRMADFTVWGAAIAEVIGYSGSAFLDAYRRNINTQNEEVLEGNVVGTLILALMESLDRWEGTPTQLLSDIKRLAVEHPIDEKQFPKNANGLTRQLKYLKPALEAAHIEWFRDIGHERTIVIRKTTESSANGATGETF